MLQCRHGGPVVMPGVLQSERLHHVRAAAPLRRWRYGWYVRYADQ